MNQNPSLKIIDKKTKNFVHRHFVLLPLFLLQSNCLPYLYHLGMEQSKILWHREPIPRALEDPSLSPKIKEKLQLVQEVREFGRNRLGLSPDSGFETYVALDREEIGWNVSACESLAFESHTWWFPIAGRVPYKGFFSYEKAKEEATALQAKGLDTRIRATGGYSTLGYFSDPVFSPQLRLDSPSLAELVIHEMSHSTVYFPGDSIFNESYASFVEEKGVERFLMVSNLLSQKDYETHKIEKKKQSQIKALFQKTALELKQVYDSKVADSRKLEQKKEVIESFKVQVVSTFPFTEKQKEKFLTKDWNNEDFIGYFRYHSGSDFFEKEFQICQSDFICFHNRMKDLKTLDIKARQRLLGILKTHKTSPTE